MILLEVLAVFVIVAGVVQLTTDFQLNSLLLLLSWVGFSEKI
jgi:hypothetical protein